MKLERHEIQGLVASGFGKQKAADFLLLTISKDAAATAKMWLGDLLPRITMSEEEHRRATLKRCIAFTAPGLLALGVPESSLQSFSKEFRQGMVTPHRQRILGDLPETASDPQGWQWGGPRNEPVHAVLMIYAPDRAACDRATAEERAALRGVSVTRVLSSVSLGGKEHFGFADGLANPYSPALHPEGLPGDAVPPGELVLGYPNLSGLAPPSPGVPREQAPQLPVCPTDPRQSDFGRNSTYIVFRQIGQDVREFWSGIARATAKAGLDPASTVDIAAKLIGRRPDGTPLPTVTGSGTGGNVPMTFADDPLGLRCPIGAHIRRANPRDALLEKPEASLTAVKLHRFLRRGRAYGAPAPAEWFPPGVEVQADDALPGGDSDERGLYFIAICADIERQFEFVQQTWMSNPKFGALFNSTDPLSSAHNPDGAFVIPGTPVRVRLSGFTSATQTVGGAYLILPSRSALQYLAGTGRR